MCCSCSLSVGVCWGLCLGNLSTPVLGRLFKQAHVHAGIDFKKYDDIEVALKVESGIEDIYIYFPLLCYCSLLEGIHHFALYNKHLLGMRVFFLDVKQEIFLYKTGVESPKHHRRFWKKSSFDQPEIVDRRNGLRFQTMMAHVE